MLEREGRTGQPALADTDFPADQEGLAAGGHPTAPSPECAAWPRYEQARNNWANPMDAAQVCRIFNQEGLWDNEAPSVPSTLRLAMFLIAVCRFLALPLAILAHFLLMKLRWHRVCQRLNFDR